MTRWVTYFYDEVFHITTDFRVHHDRESALNYFNQHCNDYCYNTCNFKATKMPAQCGTAWHGFRGISARRFNKVFAFSLDEVPEVPSHGKDFTLVEGCKQYLDSLAHLGRKVGSTT